MHDPGALHWIYPVLSWCVLVGGIVGSQNYFRFFVAPAVLRLWAESRGYAILSYRRATLWDRFRYAQSLRDWLFRTTLVNNVGRQSAALVTITQKWQFSMRVESCVVSVRWREDPKPLPSEAMPPVNDRGMWDKYLD